MKMNLIILAAVCLLGYLATQWLYKSEPPAPSVHSDFIFTDLKDRSHKLSDYRGKIVLVNFWASWCAPCVKEFPHLLQLAADNPDDIILFALSSDLEKKDIERFLAKQKGWQKPNVIIGLDPMGQVSGQFGVKMLPETLIMDKNLQIYHKLVGADWTVKEVQEKIDLLLPR